MSRLKEMENKLLHASYKLTGPRRKIMEVLLENEGAHLTAEDIHHLLRVKGNQVGLATVYRTLELFCELNILSQLNFEDSTSYYELEAKDQHPHHLICLSCNKIIEFSDEMLENFMKSIEGQYGFEVTEHKIKYLGYCSECRQ